MVKAYKKAEVEASELGGESYFKVNGTTYACIKVSEGKYSCKVAKPKAWPPIPNDITDEENEIIIEENEENFLIYEENEI